MRQSVEHGPSPWWAGFLLTSPFRRLVHDPREILSPFVKEGMRVLEPGPGRGFFTLELARLVGPKGKIFASELQTGMLEGLKRRAKRAKLDDRIDARQATRSSLGIDDSRARSISLSPSRSPMKRPSPAISSGKSSAPSRRRACCCLSSRMAMWRWLLPSLDRRGRRVRPDCRDAGPKNRRESCGLVAKCSLRPYIRSGARRRPQRHRAGLMQSSVSSESDRRRRPVLELTLSRRGRAWLAAWGTGGLGRRRARSAHGRPGRRA